MYGWINGWLDGTTQSLKSYATVLFFILIISSLLACSDSKEKNVENKFLHQIFLCIGLYILSL